MNRWVRRIVLYAVVCFVCAGVNLAWALLVGGPLRFLNWVVFFLSSGMGVACLSRIPRTLRLEREIARLEAELAERERRHRNGAPS